MPDDRARRVTASLYGGLWSVLSDWLKVPREPPTLPSAETDEIETFRPAPGFLRYLKLQLWVLLVLADGFLVALWVGALVVERWLGALLALPVLGLVVIPGLMAYTAVHLRYDTTWYILSDRSLRIRRGIMTVVETTITFDNVQNLEIKQGPVQRCFGIATLVVETAGGGQAPNEEGGEGSHVGRIEGVADAQRIRDLILFRVRGRAVDASEARAEPWPTAHLEVLREIRRGVGSGRGDGGEALALPPDEEPLPAGRIERALARLFRLPGEPPTLPRWAGRRYRFRPAPPYLWYRLASAFLAGSLVAAIPWAVVLPLVLEHPDLLDRVRVGLVVGAWLVLLLWILALSLLTAWLQYRVTWYVLGERGLRIRRGVWTLREVTLSFDNVQNVNLRQGPLERLFGLSSVHLHTGGGTSSAAGGGGPAQILGMIVAIAGALVPALGAITMRGGTGKSNQGPSTGVRLDGVVDSPAIRDRIMARVRASRSAGLGDDPDAPRRVRWTPEQLTVLREIRRLVAP